MLAGLIAQAESRGADLATLRALIEEACDRGAERALSRLGLSDGDARQDIDELRELLQAWRDAKRTARAAVIGWVVRGRSEEHTSEIQSLMRISYAVFCLKNTINNNAYSMHDDANTK